MVLEAFLPGPAGDHCPDLLSTFLLFVLYVYVPGNPADHGTSGPKGNLLG